MNQKILEVKDLVTRFGAQLVHDKLNFSIEAGKIIAIIGGSGTGKSVLLRSAIGLLKPSAGEVRLFNKLIYQLPEDQLNTLRNKIGVLFQNGALFSALNVYQNIALPILEKFKIKDNNLDSIVSLRLALSGLGQDVLYKMPNQLSGGMKKRVALARALALEPEVLFLDEPTSGLDPINARSFDEMIRSLVDNIGITVVMVTHDLSTIRNIVDQILVLSGSKLVANGSLEQVLHSQDPWIKQYFK